MLASRVLISLSREAIAERGRCRASPSETLSLRYTGAWASEAEGAGNCVTAAAPSVSPFGLDTSSARGPLAGEEIPALLLHG